MLYIIHGDTIWLCSLCLFCCCTWFKRSVVPAVPSAVRHLVITSVKFLKVYMAVTVVFLLVLECGVFTGHV